MRSARTREKHPPLVLAVNTLLARGFVFIRTQENRRSLTNVYFRTDCQGCEGHKIRLKLVKVTSRAARFAFKTSLFTDLLFLTEIIEQACESAGHKEKNVRFPWPAPMKTSVDRLILYFRSLRSKDFQSSYCVACEYNRFSLFLAASKEKGLYSQTSYCAEAGAQLSRRPREEQARALAVFLVDMLDSPFRYFV